MRILHISTPNSWRGGEQQMGYLLLEQQKLNLEPHVFCNSQGPVPSFCEKYNIPFGCAKERFAVNPTFALKVARYCNEHKIKLIHVHDSHAHTFAVLAHVLFGIKIPIVVSRRVDFSISKSPLSRFKYNYKAVKKILCVSNTIESIMRNDVEKPERLATVHSGIDISRFQNITKPSITLREQYQISTKYLIGNVAALAPHKDYKTFIETAEELLKLGLDATFLIIGDGPLKQDVSNWVEESSAKNNIIMTGFRTDIPTVLAQLDLFLITSETEGLGTSILDAFACKVPVVATRAGGIPELVKHNKTGLSSGVKMPKDLAKNVVAVLEDKSLRNELIVNSQDLLKAFTTTSVAQKTLVHYKEVLDLE